MNTHAPIFVVSTTKRAFTTTKTALSAIVVAMRTKPSGVGVHAREVVLIDHGEMMTTTNTKRGDTGAAMMMTECQ
jgi:hypothetical protein